MVENFVAQGTAATGTRAEALYYGKDQRLKVVNLDWIEPPSQVVDLIL